MKFRHITRLAVVAGVAAGSFVLAGVPAEPASAAPGDEIIAFEARGTGFGHGRGMGQMGAIGRALDGQSVDEILGAYFGGTEYGTRSKSDLRVRILGADNDTTIGVISRPGDVSWSSATSGSDGGYSSLYAVEVGENRFDLFAAESGLACPGAADLPVPNGPLSQGSEGTAVEQLQRVLNALGFDAGVVDGDFGPNTAGAVERFEAANDLAVDGVWSSTEAAIARERLASADDAVAWEQVGDGVTGPVRITTTARSAGGDALGLCRSDGSVRHYRGALEVRETEFGIRLVNEVDVEHYLRGVVPMEMWHGYGAFGDGRGMEALEAQAVASRSYALSQGRYGYAETCDTTSCQLYAGSANRSSPTSTTISPVERAATDEAIAETAGRVRVWPGSGDVAATEYSASNGPRTAGGAFPPVDDPWDDNEYHDNHRWTRTIDADEIASAYGLSSVDGVGTFPDADSPYDGIWANEVRLTAEQTVSAWSFRNRFDLPSPGFELVAITEGGGGGGGSGEARLAVPGTVLRVPVTGVAGVPSSGVGFVSLNVTTTLGVEPGHATLWACGSGEPSTSLVNYVPGVDAPNAVVVPVDSTGEVCVSVLKPVHLVIDVLGFSEAELTSAFDRLIDTRERSAGRVVPGTVLRVPVTGVAGVPSSGVGFVSLNVTTTLGVEPGHATLWACGSGEPSTSLVNYVPGVDAPNAVVVPVDSTGEVCVSVLKPVHLVIDVLGFSEAELTSAFDRLIDTRERSAGRVVPGTVLRVPVTGVAGVPSSGVGFVSLNVTTTLGVEPGHATLWACGSGEPSTSLVNYVPGVDAPNAVVVPVDSTGEVCVSVLKPVHLVIDVLGFSEAELTSAFDRILDTRIGLGPIPPR